MLKANVVARRADFHFIHAAFDRVDLSAVAPNGKVVDLEVQRNGDGLARLDVHALEKICLLIMNRPLISQMRIHF